MEAIVKLGDGGSSEEWQGALDAFNAENLNQTTFVDRYDRETKEKVVKSLVDKLMKRPSAWTDVVANSALITIKLLSRETTALEAVFTTEFVSYILNEARISNTEEGGALQIEAAKALVNITMRDSTGIVSKLLFDNNYHVNLLALLKEGNKKELIFPFSRLIFILSMDENIAEKFNEANALEIFTAALGEALKDLSKPENIVYATETMKTLFKLTIALGPLADSYPETGKPKEPTEKELAVFRELIPHLITVLKLETNATYHPLKEAIVNCLINVPGPCVDWFPPEETLGALIEILKVQLRDTLNPANALTGILLVLTSIAKAIPRARAILIGVLFPNYNPDSANVAVEAPACNVEDSQLGSILIKHMTSFNIALKHNVNEFLFAICGEDPNELVKLTGFGNAAGLLATHNLFSALGGGAKATSVTTSEVKPPTNEELQREHNESVNGPDPSLSTGRPMGFLDSLSEEEKEREAEKLYHLLEKLESQGIIKVVRKDDEPGAGKS